MSNEPGFTHHTRKPVALIFPSASGACQSGSNYNVDTGQLGVFYSADSKGRGLAYSLTFYIS